jgi:ankyrin repeat protein
LALLISSCVSSSGADLHQLVAANATNEVVSVLAAGANVHRVNHRRQTALHQAARLGRVDAMRLLLEGGADPNATDAFGLSPLLWAGLHGYRPLHELTYATGETVVSLSDLSARRRREIQAACLARSAEMVSLLLTAGASPAGVFEPHGYTPLHFAAILGHAANVEALLQRGSPLEATDAAGNSALHLAARHGHREVVKLLLGHGADAAVRNDAGQTALDSYRAGSRQLVHLPAATWSPRHRPATRSTAAARDCNCGPR